MTARSLAWFGLSLAALSVAMIAGCPNVTDNSGNNSGNNGGGSTLTGKFVGAATCALCHNQVHSNWSGTHHAQAFQSLKNAGQSTNTLCLTCHSVGHGQDGGFVDEATTAALEGVQCESCHGAGGAYARDFIMKDRPLAKALGLLAPGEARCKTCHVGHGAGGEGFDYARKVQAIIHWKRRP